MVILVFYALTEGSLPILFKEGLHFVIGTDWNPVEGRESFGALPYIVGTLVSSAIAMVIAVPISIGIAIFVNEMVPGKMVLFYLLSLNYLLQFQVLYMDYGRYLCFDFI